MDLDESEKMKKKIPDHFFQIPLQYLSHATKEQLKFLDCLFIVPDHNVILRDFRGLAILQGYDTIALNILIDEKRIRSPTLQILEVMERNQKSLGDLIHSLQQLKRCDLLERIKDNCNEDVKNYYKTVMNEKKVNYSSEMYNQIASQREIDEDQKSLEKLFTTDIMCETKKKIDIYDVFICFDSESIADIKVMWQLSRILEENAMSVAKGSFSFLQGCCLHDAFANAIYNRSRKVILLISQSFIQSESCVMQLNFAKDSDKAAWKNKVIPVYIENVKKPDCIANINDFKYYDEYIQKEFMQYFVNSIKHC